jgi:hypothetical protein
MELPICRTCGVQYDEAHFNPYECKICADERQYVGWDGQRWTTLAELRNEGHRGVGWLYRGLYNGRPPLGFPSVSSEVAIPDLAPEAKQARRGGVRQAQQSWTHTKEPQHSDRYTRPQAWCVRAPMVVEPPGRAEPERDHWLGQQRLPERRTVRRVRPGQQRPKGDADKQHPERDRWERP